MAPRPPSTVRPISAPQSFHGLDPNFVPPLAHEFNLGVEQALPGKMSLSVGYVGTRALRLPVFLDANLVGQTPHGIRTYNVSDANNNVIQQITVPVYLQSDRRNSAITSMNTGFSVANTWYNSLAVTVRRPFSNGLEVLANYTWARATDTGQVQGTNGTFYGGDTPLDPNNPRRDNGPSDTDIRNRFALSFVYQPQFFKDNKWTQRLIDDWLFSGGFIASGGEPIFLGMSGTVYSRHRNQLRSRRQHLRRRHELQLRCGHHRPSAADRTQQHLQCRATTTSTSAYPATSPSTRASTCRSRRTPSTCSTTPIITSVNGTLVALPQRWRQLRTVA